MQGVSSTFFAAGLLGLCLPLAAAAQDATPATKVSAQIFVNASQLDRDGVVSDDEGLALDLKRTFITVDHRFNENWSAQVTTDFQWSRNSDPSDLWLRHAYLQRSFGKGNWLRFGNAPLPWIQQESVREGYRYVDGALITRAKMGNAADYGVHGQYTHGDLTYAASVVTGGGYQKPRLGRRADVEARVGWVPLKGVELAVGGYRGTRAQDAGDRPREHTAQRWNAMASWVGERARVGAQYFRAEDWSRVVKPGSDDQRGWSGWASYQLSPQYAVFTRHEETRMSLDIDPRTRERYSMVGVEWKPNRHLRLAAVGKQVRAETAKSRLESHEAGLWAQIAF
ncbi:MAG: hypothetical protein ACN6O2_04885 [Stenotrophomonas sp.]